MSVQIRADLGLSLTDMGIMVASSFAVAGTSSPLMGRLAQKLGTRLGARVGLTGTPAVTMLLIALVGDNLPVMMGLLGLAGGFNALTQPSVNLLLATRIRPARLGLALAIKQSAMPGATLLGGAAVPIIALTVGWRWAYVAAAGLTVIAFFLQPPAQAETATTGAKTPDGEAKGLRPKPDMATSLLIGYSVVGLLAAWAATLVANIFTSAATDSGLSPGTAGWLLAFASAAGITSRLYQGWTADHNGVLPIQRVVWLLAIGAAMQAFMLFDVSLAYGLAIAPFFATGWAWPGLFNLSVIRNNPSATASATGVTQAGIFIGAGLGPLTAGLVAQDYGYKPAWLIGSSALALGAGLALVLRSRVRAARLAKTPA